jgi:hypothetical protein
MQDVDLEGGGGHPGAGQAMAVHRPDPPVVNSNLHKYR